jgi:hypothetical protein
MVADFIRLITEGDSMLATEEKTEYKLKMTDRCDACDGQAYVSVTGITGELMFCAHHYSKIMNSPSGKAAMLSFALETVDERERLSVKSGVYI